MHRVKFLCLSEAKIPLFVCGSGSRGNWKLFPFNIGLLGKCFNFFYKFRTIVIYLVRLLDTEQHILQWFVQKKTVTCGHANYGEKEDI